MAVLPTPAAGSTGDGRSPLATPDQLSAERLAERLSAAPSVRAAGAAITQQWRAALIAKLGSLSDQANALLQPSVDELVFAYAQKVANSDPARPKVTWIESPPHRWFGHSVPGGRYAADNPDTIYRIVPIDGVSSYVVRGRVNQQRPAATLFQVVSDVNLLTPVDTLDGRSVIVRPDGTFTLIVDPSPGNGRPNQLRTNAKTIQLFIRDTLSNWNTQTPLSVSVKRRAGPPAAHRPFDQLVADTVQQLKIAGPLWMNFYIAGVLFAPPPNVTPPPVVVLGIGRSSGNFKLTDDQALVITAQPAGASYLSMVIQNAWSITPDYWERQSSLTNDQSVPNPDGTYTFVVSQRDPGIYNWVDTTGLQQGTFLVRWQGLPSPPPPSGAVPSVSAKVVDFADLASTLPAGTITVTPPQRAGQLEQRLAGFDRRIATCSCPEND